jgi:hypothetical protein
MVFSIPSYSASITSIVAGGQFRRAVWAMDDSHVAFGQIFLGEKEV